MRKQLLIIPALLATLAVAGCGGQTPADAQPAATASPAPTDDTVTATAQQWASVIAPLAREWRDQLGTVEDNCDRGSQPACSIGHVTLTLLAERYVLELGMAGDPDHSRFVGEPPAEVAALVEQTVEAAEAVPAAVQGWMASGCVDPLDCFGDYLPASIAIKDMTAAFDRWSPYL